MNLFGVFEISGSALSAERWRAEVVASNMANAETTRTPEGGPYRRRELIFRSQQIEPFSTSLATFGVSASPGVQVDGVIEDAASPIRRYEPGHPDADAEGYVAYPAIDPVDEMVDLMGATRAYEFNASAVQATKSMIQQSFEILH